MANTGMSAEQLQALREQMLAGQQAGQQSPPPPSMQQQQQQYAQQMEMQRMRDQQMRQAAMQGGMSPQQQQQSSLQQTPPQQQAPQQRPTAQQAMMARMEASRNQQSAGGQQTVMTQGEQYAPTQQPGPIDQTQPHSQSQGQQGGVRANNTIINTTQSDGDDGGSKGFKMNPMMAVGIVIAVLVLVFFGYSYLSKNGGSGNEVENPSTEYDPFSDPNIEWVDPGSNYSYTLDEIQMLRAAGYTGDEIESYAAQQTPYKDLIKQAEAERDAYIQQAIAPLYDTASDEYKHFVSQTWLTLPKRDDTAEWTSIAMNYSKRENLDYEKIDVYGNQLFIKIYLDDNLHKDWFFCSVTPEEWNKLNDFGNIIVNYTYCTRYVGDDDMWSAVEDTEHIYIIDASIEFVN